MDAVGVIKENMNVERILNHYGVDFQYYGEFIRSACPIHKGDNPTAFVVNEEFLWACHTNSECGVGDVFTFVEKMEDVSFPQAVKIVAQILEIDIDNLIIAERKNDYLKEVERFMKYIKSKRRTKKVIEEYTPNAELTTVKSFRNFNEETLRHFDLRYAKEVEGNEIEVNFGVAIQKHIDEDLTKKEREEIEKLSVEISKIVSKAVKRKIDEQIARDSVLLGNRQLKIAYQRNGESDVAPINLQFDNQIVTIKEV